MSKRYERQDEQSEIVLVLGEVRDLYHPRLSEVTIDVLTVVDYDEESGEECRCLKLHGYPAAAIVKVMSHERRAQGSGDALLTIDGIAWHELGPAARVALLDHELTHLELCEKDGTVARDDLRRPKLKLRLHDVEIGGFREVMGRHREHALEVMQVRRCRAESGQYFWDFDAAAPSVRIESGSRSVTLTPAHREALRSAADMVANENVRPVVRS